MTCECEVCVRLRTVEARIEQLPEEHRQFFRDFYDEAEEVRFNRNYLRALVDGSYPNADMIIGWKRSCLRRRREREERNGKLH